MQEDSSGCEGQSSCTLLTPCAKRIRRDHRATPTSPSLESARSFESTALHACKGSLDVVGDNGGHLTLSAGDAEMTDGEDEGGKPQVRSCTAAGSSRPCQTVFGMQMCRSAGCSEQGQIAEPSINAPDASKLQTKTCVVKNMTWLDIRLAEGVGSGAGPCCAAARGPSLQQHPSSNACEPPQECVSAQHACL